MPNQSEEIQFLRASRSDLDEVYDLHILNEGEKRNRYIWEWEYGNGNPLGSLLLIAKHRDKIIATEGMFIIPLIIGEKVYYSGKDESTLVDLAYRGKGMGDLLYNFALQEFKKHGVACVWGFTRKALKLVKRAGYSSYPDAIKRAVIAFNYSNTYQLVRASKKFNFKPFLLKTIIAIVAVYSKFVCSLHTKQKIQFNQSTSDKLLYPDDLIKLYEKVGIFSPKQLSIYPNNTFYEWRVLKSPKNKWQLFIYQNGEIAGCLIVTLHDGSAEILDFCFINTKVGKMLLQKFIEFSKGNNISIAFYTGNHTNYINKGIFSLLKKFGFLITNAPNTFVFKELNYTGNFDLFDITKWYINGMWSEGT